MLNFSVTEIIFTAAVAVLALKPEDVAALVKYYHRLRKSITETASELPDLFLDSDAKKHLAEIKRDFASIEEDFKSAEPKIIIGDDGASYVAYPEFAEEIRSRKGRPSKTPTAIHLNPDHEESRP